MNNGAPPLSVIMSVYNGEEYLESAIESVLDQTFRDFEFVIVNDGSSDRSLEIIQGFAARDNRIRIIDQENTGLTVALVNGVAQSRGKFIARMDADDLSLPTRFERQMAAFDDAGEVIAVTCHVQHFSDDDGDLYVKKLNMKPELIPLHLCFRNAIGGHGQVIFRRSAYDAAGGYDPAKRFAQDYDLWARLVDHGGFAEVQEPLYKFRTGHDSISKRSRSGQEDSSIATCTREFRKLTGEDIREETGLALRYFWWGVNPRAIPTSEVGPISRSMNLAISTFFARHPHLAGDEFELRRKITKMWWQRFKRLPVSTGLHKAAFLAKVLPWGLSTLRARSQRSTEKSQ